MLFSPVRFHGVRVPGLRELSSVLPHRVQEIPGLMQGGAGWQGIIPARAAKMGSIAVRKAISKLGTPAVARSRDVWQEDEEHPAYARILGDLAPDEARVLMLLLRSGPQPSVDVRTGGPVGRVHSQLIAPGLTMIGARAGCRYVERVPAYLNNLHRLGLVWFSREQLTDPMEYQVLEAQPDVLAALHAQRFSKVVRRSIHLTPFGDDFCRAVLAPAGDDADYPHHEPPLEEEDDRD